MRTASVAMVAAVMLGACDTRNDRMAEGQETEAAVKGNAGEDAPLPAPSPVAEVAPIASPTPAASVATDAWIGRWVGVEGLVLDVARDPAEGAGHYQLTMQYTLDENGVFPGVADGDTIRFTRPDGVQVLRATDGAATGLKYLDGKRDCLTVKAGEGYCRD